ncbi:MAG: glycosyltransferase family 9 protein [Candidatus Omnitrophica bacterium]|nr:glycosyltransferase family 9 protein [Candidatus Omnitrophota bacterium]
MKINIMQQIDHYAGPVICKLLLFLRSFTRPARPSDHLRLPDNPRNILVIKFFGIGTILLASPALRELKKKYKNAKITMLTLSQNHELCEILSCIDNAVYLNIESPLGFLVSLLRTIPEIRKRDFDIVIDLEFLTNFSALVALLVTLFDRPRVTVGFSSPINWRNRIHNINVSFDHSRHITRIFAKMFCSLTGETFEPSFEFERAALLQRMDREYTNKLFSSNAGLEEANSLICVNVNAGDLSLHRRWPKDYFAEVIKELIKRPDVAVVLIGAGSDVEYVSELKRLLPPSSRIVDVSGGTDIKELIGLFAKSKLLITNDSGPFHLAEVIGLPTVSFFGPETPYLYGPIDKKHYVFYEDLYCSPCLNIYNSKMSHCKNNTCLKNIKPGRVIKAIDEICNIPGQKDRLESDLARL